MATEQPPQFNPGELLAYLNGTASPALRKKIKTALADPEFRAELLALHEADLYLSAALYRASCPSSDDLYAYHSDTLPLSQRTQLSQHTEQCAHCQAELRWLAAADSESTDFASSWTSKAGQLLGEVKKAVVKAWHVPQSPRLAPAVRGQQKTQSIYQAEGYRLVVVLTPPLAYEQIWEVEGQVINLTEQGPVEPPATLSILQEDEILLHDELDDFGYFSLDRVESGTYTLALDLPTTRILIEDFHVS